MRIKVSGTRIRMRIKRSQGGSGSASGSGISNGGVGRLRRRAVLDGGGRRREVRAPAMDRHRDAFFADPGVVEDDYRRLRGPDK
jgi:hypothetical protein